MKGKMFPLIVLLIIAAGIYYIVWGRDGDKNDPTRMILYYGDPCPHCKVVNDFVKKKKVERKLKLVKKEVFQNKENYNELIERAVICGIAANEVGVPLVWNGNGCWRGDDSIIAELTKKLEER